MADTPRVVPGTGTVRTYHPPGSDGWADDMDNNLASLSLLTQLTVESLTAALPGSPANGYVTIDPATKEIVGYDQDHWYRIAPKAGWSARVKDQGNAEAVYTGSSGGWVIAAGGGEYKGDHGTAMRLRVLVEDLTAAGGETYLATVGSVPIGSLILGVRAVVLEDVVGPSALTINVDVPGGTLGTAYTPSFFALTAGQRTFAAQFSPALLQWNPLHGILTADSGTFTSGKVRMAIYYIETIQPDTAP